MRQLRNKKAEFPVTAALAVQRRGHLSEIRSCASEAACSLHVCNTRGVGEQAVCSVCLGPVPMSSSLTQAMKGLSWCHLLSSA